MHMADALISPIVGGAMWATTAGLIAYSSKKVTQEADERKIALMGVLGAFVFAAQMINFTIPATGSSGHLGGGMLLSIILGPYAAFLVMSSILTVQALFFADGGILSLGCNIFNLGFFPCFIAYPFIYRLITNKASSQKRIIWASIFSALAALQMGALGVVLETVISGISELPFSSFVLLMQPIHLAIGIVEGFVTATMALFIFKARPEILEKSSLSQRLGQINIKKIVIALTLVTLFTGGILSWFASAQPDGLEWSMKKTSGKEELEGKTTLHSIASSLQKSIAFLPDYSFKKVETEQAPLTQEAKESWPAVDLGTSISSFVGGLFTFLLVIMIGFVVRRRTAKLNE